MTSRMPPPFPSESLLLRPVRPLLAAHSLVDLCVGSPLGQDVSGAPQAWASHLSPQDLSLLIHKMG